MTLAPTILLPTALWIEYAKSIGVEPFKEENIVRGKELLEKYCKSKSIRLPELMKPEYIKKVELKYGFKDWDSVCAAVGHGGLKEGQVINKKEEDRKIQKQKITDEQILQKTTEGSHNLFCESRFLVLL